MENDMFLSNHETVSVYWPADAKAENKAAMDKQPEKTRKVIPQKDGPTDSKQGSRLEPAEAEFRQLIGDANRGIVARFFQDRLKLLMWYRPPSNSKLIFGAQLRLSVLEGGLQLLGCVVCQRETLIVSSEEFSRKRKAAKVGGAPSFRFSRFLGH